MKKVALLLSLIMAFTLASCGVTQTMYIGSAQYAVSGRVVARGGEGVAGVNLTIGKDVVATTDSDGKYSLSDLQGAKTLTAQKEGYALSPKQIKLSYARQDADFNAVRTAEPEPEPEPEPPSGTIYPVSPYNKITAPAASDSFSLYDTFDNGVKPDGVWGIGTRGWSNPAFKGAFPYNVAYTSDGVLLLRSKGELYPDPNKRMTGSVIVTKERFGPGVYDMSMKIAPRLGVCTAVWPLYNDGQGNHEVDIEFPGHPNNPTDRGLDYMMSTTWTTEGNYRTNQVDLRANGLTPANDGKWHRYTIDWRTTDVDPNGANGGTSEDKIDWYIDGVKVSTLTGGVVARKAGQLWLGTWMPRGWAGPSNYESADMQLDWVTVKEYSIKAGVNMGDDAHKNTDIPTDAPDAYPLEAVDYNEYNWISDANFMGNKTAWQRDPSNDPAAREVYLDYLGTKAAFRFKNNATISQKIDATYEGYKYELKADFVERRAGSTFTIKAEYMNNFGAIIGAPVIYNAKAEKNILTVPQGAKNIKITISSAGNGVIDLKNIELFRTWEEAEVTA